MKRMKYGVRRVSQQPRYPHQTQVVLPSEMRTVKTIVALFDDEWAALHAADTLLQDVYRGDKLEVVRFARRTTWTARSIDRAVGSRVKI